MKGIATPFGRERRGRAAAWPAWAGSERRSALPESPVDPWLEMDEPFEGGVVLEDLVLADDAADAARVLAVYVIVRLTLSTVRAPPGFLPDVERMEARSWLSLLPEADPDRRTLGRLVDQAGHGTPDSRFARRIDAAAVAAMGRSRRRSAFGLLCATYASLKPHGRQHSDAALLARRLAMLAAEAGSSAAARRWNLRAAAHERRAVAE